MISGRAVIGWSSSLQVLKKTAAATDSLRADGVDLSRWFVPEGYVIQSDV